MRLRVQLIFFGISFLGISHVHAATSYIAPSPLGSDSNAGTSAAPWATFQYAFTTMRSGDTLIVKDGTYNQDLGQWTFQNNVIVPTSVPPNGSPTALTVVQAENVGRAVINGGINIVGASYVRVEGFRTTGGVFIDGGSAHIEAKKIGAKQGVSTSRSSYILKEDIWAWGSDRYVIMNFEADHIIDNRVIARLDDMGTTQTLPVGAMAHYLTNYSVIANALLFDVSGNFQQPYDLVYSSRPSIGFNQLWGIIGFNAGQLGGFYPGDGGGGGHEIHNSVIWGTSRECVWFNSPGPNTVSNVTCGANAGPSVKGYYNIGVTNSIFVNNGGGIDNATISACDNNLFYNSGPVLSNCTNSVTSDPGVRYLPRSPVAGKGATIEKRYSITEVNGVYVVSETNENLWPWPYEDLIKTDLCTGITKGWCATNKSLTQYIWEYLGNPCPAEICSGAPSPVGDRISPSAPKGLTVR